MHDAAHVPSYRSYWIAWAILLVLTVAMIAVSSRALILGGIAAKSTIIALWFMHLKNEKAGLVLSVVFSIVFFSLFLFFLLSFDARIS